MKKFEFPDDWTEEEKARIVNNPFGKDAGIPYGKLSKIRDKNGEIYKLTVIFDGAGITYKDSLIYSNYADAVADKKDFIRLYDVKTANIIKLK